jgi:hypothetical protein
MSGIAKAGRGLNGLLVLLLALAGGALIAMSPDIALPLAILLLPGLLALMFDRSPGGAVARATLLFQAAACVHPILHAWYRCEGVDGCMADLTDWPSLLAAWLTAAFAWLLTQIVPLGLKMLDDHRVAQRRQTLAERRQTLVEEWGLDDV